MNYKLLQVCGAAIGVVAALLVIEARSKPAPVSRSDGAMLAEFGPSLREIVIQYVSGDTIAGPVYQSFLPQLPADVRVDVVCPDSASYRELIDKLGPVRCSFRSIVTGHEMTVWSRDRWIALRPDDPITPVTLFAPTEEDGSANWPQRAGDARIALDIAKSLPGEVTARRLPLYFDGGDLLAVDESNVFVAPMVLTKNLNRTVASRDELIALLHRTLGRKIILLDEAPEHHIGMYMMAVGDRTMLVGDPNLGKPLISSTMPEIPDGPDLSQTTQHQFDAVAAQAAAEGYRVVRIPTVLSPNAKTYLTYVNVITDQEAGRKIVYLPAYRGAEALNDAAAQVWRGIGYEVRPVDCTTSYRYFGNLHCLVNILRRE